MTETPTPLIDVHAHFVTDDYVAARALSRQVNPGHRVDLHPDSA
jgi:hypothetical protein